MKSYLGLRNCRYCGRAVPVSAMVEEDTDGRSYLVGWKSACQQAFRMHRVASPKCREAWEEAGRLLRKK